MRRVEPLINLALLLPRRPREFRDRVAGYADLGLERLWRSSPAYETARWQDVLRDIEEHLGRVTEILDEPALKEVEDDTRRLLEDIRARDPFSPRWLRFVPSDLTFRSAGDWRGLRCELGLYPEGPRGERPRHTPQRRPASPEERIQEVLGHSRTRSAQRPLETTSGVQRQGSAPAPPRDPHDRPLRTRQPAHPREHAPRVRYRMAQSSERSSTDGRRRREEPRVQRTAAEKAGTLARGPGQGGVATPRKGRARGVRDRDKIAFQHAPAFGCRLSARRPAGGSQHFSYSSGSLPTSVNAYFPERRFVVRGRAKPE